MAFISFGKGISPDTLNFFQLANAITGVKLLGGVDTSMQQITVPASELGSVGFSRTIKLDEMSFDSRYFANLTNDRLLLFAGQDITMDSSKVISGGTVQTVFLMNDGDTAAAFIDINIAAAEFAAASRTHSTADDKALLAKAMGGNDFISFDSDASNDKINARGGKDYVLSFGGDDRLMLGAGNDLTNGGAGNDTVWGNVGNDIIIGGAGRDRMIGGMGNDLFFADGESDVMFGGAGKDQFLFSDASSRSRIADYEDGQDKILLRVGADGFSDLEITQGKGFTDVSYGKFTVRLTGVDADDLTAADFIFGSDAGEAARVNLRAFFGNWDYTA